MDPPVPKEYMATDVRYNLKNGGGKQFGKMPDHIWGGSHYEMKVHEPDCLLDAFSLCVAQIRYCKGAWQCPVDGCEFACNGFDRRLLTI